MPDISIRGYGELRPDWLIKIEEGLDAAYEQGWNLKQPLVMEGHPYIWEGEPQMATWTVPPRGEDDHE